MERKELKNFLRSGETIFMNRFVEPVKQLPHTHDFLELEYVISGEGIHQVGDTEIPVSSGYVFSPILIRRIAFCRRMKTILSRFIIAYLRRNH